MRLFIFYTNEGYTQDPKGIEVENSQLLGTAEGNTAKEAFENLLNENHWIMEHGFSVGAGNVKARELLNGKQFLF